MALKKDKFEQMNRLLRNYMINMKHFYTELAPELDVTPQQAHTLFYMTNCQTKCNDFSKNTSYGVS